MQSPGDKLMLIVAVNTPLGSRVDGLALASQSRALYYTDSRQNEIVMMSLDGKSRKVLISQNLTSPRAVVVDERSGSVILRLHHEASTYQANLSV